MLRKIWRLIKISILERRARRCIAAMNRHEACRRRSEHRYGATVAALWEVFPEWQPTDSTVIVQVLAASRKRNEQLAGIDKLPS